VSYCAVLPLPLSAPNINNHNALTYERFGFPYISPCTVVKMSQQSFPGGTSSPSSNNDDLATDDTTDDGNMGDYVKRWEERNSEETHKAALAAAHAHHTAVREKALEVLEISKLREETEKLRQKRIQTEERVRLETERAMEELRIREEENKAKLIPKPPPRVPTPPQPIQQPVQQPKQPEFTSAPANQPVNQLTQAPKQASAPNVFQSSQTQPPPNTSQANLKQPTSQQTTPATASHPMQAQLQVSAQQPKQAQQPTQAPSTTAQRPQAPSNAPQARQAPWTARPASQHLEEQKIMHQSVDRYADIHKNLKDLRDAIRQFGELNRQFKNEAGAMRRAIIMSVGQLTEGRGVNKVQVSGIYLPRALEYPPDSWFRCKIFAHSSMHPWPCPFPRDSKELYSSTPHWL
jgi:nucleoporin GLE1